MTINVKQIQAAVTAVKSTLPKEYADKIVWTEEGFPAMLVPKAAVRDPEETLLTLFGELMLRAGCSSQRHKSYMSAEGTIVGVRLRYNALPQYGEDFGVWKVVSYNTEESLRGATWAFLWRPKS